MFVGGAERRGGSDAPPPQAGLCQLAAPRARSEFSRCRLRHLVTQDRRLAPCASIPDDWDDDIVTAVQKYYQRPVVFRKSVKAGISCIDLDGKVVGRLTGGRCKGRSRPIAHLIEGRSITAARVPRLMVPLAVRPGLLRSHSPIPARGHGCFTSRSRTYLTGIGFIFL